MRLDTLQRANSLLGQIKKVENAISQLETTLHNPNKLSLGMGGGMYIQLETDIKITIIKDTIKTLGIKRTALQTDFDELEDIEADSEED